MSAHALITASADPFFQITKAVRAELAQLEKMAAQITVGSAGGNGGTQTKAQIALQQQLGKAIAQVKKDLLDKLQAEENASRSARAHASTTIANTKAQTAQAIALARVAQATANSKNAQNRAAISAKKLEDALNGVARAARNSYTSLDRIRDTALGIGVANVTTQTLAKAWDVAKGAVIDFNAQQQQTLTALQSGLGGSSEKAKVLLGDLQKLADKSPFREKTFSDTATKFLGAKIPTGDIKNALRGVNEQASALGGDPQKFSQIATALNQIWIKPRLGLEELTQQLVEHGVPAFDLLAKSYGTNTTQIQEWISKGLIPGKEAARALWTEMERENFGAAAKQAKTFTGVLSTLGDRLNRGLGAIGTRALWLGATALPAAVTRGVASLAALQVSFLAAGGASVVMAGVVGVALAALATDFMGIRSKMVDGWKSLTTWLARQYDGVAKFLNLEGGFEASVKATMPDVNKTFAGFKSSLTDKMKSLDLGALMPDTSKWMSGYKTSDIGIPPAAYNPRLSEPRGAEESAEKKAASAAKKLYLDQLNDAKAMYEGIAKAAEDNAKRQIDAIVGVRDNLRDLFGSVQNEFAELGRIDDPFSKTIAKWTRFFNLSGQMKTAVAREGATYANAMRKAGDAASLADKKRGGDGFNAKYSNTGSADVARSMLGMTGADNRVARAMGTSYGDEWCVGFAQIVSQQAGEGKLVGGALSVDAVRKWAKEVDRAYKGIPKVGDYATMKGLPNARSHIGVVSKVNGNGTFETIGGNEGSRNNYRSRVREGARYRSDDPGVLFVRSGASSTQSSPKDNARVSDLSKVLEKGEKIIWIGGRPNVVSIKGNTGMVDAYQLAEHRGVKLGSSTRSAATPSAATVTASSYMDAGTSNSFAELINQARNFSGSLGTLKALPKEYGAAVEKTDKTTHQFALQLAFMSEKGQEILKRIPRGQWGKFFKEIRADFKKADQEISNSKQWSIFKERQKAQAKEFGKNYTVAANVARREISALQAQMSGKIGDPAIAALNARIRPGGDLASLRSTKKGRGVINDIYDKTRALSAKAEAAALESVNKELRDRTSLLTIEQDALRSGRMTQTQLTDRLEVEVYRRQQVAELLRDPKLAAQAIDIAKERTAIFARNLELGRSVALTRELMNSRAQAATSVALSQQMSGIYSSTRSGTIEQDRQLALAQKLSELNSGTDTGYDTADSGFMRDFKKTYDANQQTELARNSSAANGNAVNALRAIENQLTQQQLEMQGQLTDIARQKLDWQLEDLQRAQTANPVTQIELDTRQKMLGVMEKISALKPQKWFKDFSIRAKIEMEQDEIKRARMELEQQLIAAGMDKFFITPILDMNESLLKLQQTKAHIQDFMGQLNGIMGTGLDALYTDGFGGFFASIASGFSNLLNDISKQIISAALTKIVMSAFPQLATAYDNSQQKVTQLASATLASAAAASAAAIAYTAAAKAAAAFAAAGSGGASGGGGGGILSSLISGIGGALIGGIGAGSKGAPAGVANNATLTRSYAPIVKPVGFHRSGLDVVPRDGYRAVLHKNEAVLNASDAHTWRNQNAAMAAPSRTSKSNERTSVVSNSNNTNIGTIVLPNVREPADFAPALAAATSRRTQQQQANDFVSPGGSRR